MKAQLYLIFVVSLTIALVVPTFVSAATQDSYFYFLSTFFEKVDLFFTFNAEKKIQKNLLYAEKHLSEVKEMALQKKLKYTEEALSKYENNISTAINKAKSLQDREKAEEFLNNIGENTSGHKEVLEELLIKVSDEAKSAIERAIQMSSRQQEQLLKEVDNLKKELGELKEETQEFRQEIEQFKPEKKKLDEDSQETREQAPKKSLSPSLQITPSKPTSTSPVPQLETISESGIIFPTPSGTKVEKGSILVTPQPNASELARDFKLSFKVQSDRVVLSAEGYRDKIPSVGQFKWWKVVDSAKTLGTIRIGESGADDIVPVRFEDFIMLTDKENPIASGYEYYFQFVFEKGNTKSYSDPVTFIVPFNYQSISAEQLTTTSTPVTTPTPITTQTPTLPPADITPPKTSDVSSSNITSSGATITWTTDEPSDSQVEYGLTSSYGNITVLDSSLVKSHSASLLGLQANTAYHFRVKSKDGIGNVTTGSDQTFTTLAVSTVSLPPLSSNSPYNGSFSVLRFKITASRYSDIILNSFTFRVATSSITAVDGYIYGYSDPFFSVNAYANRLNSKSIDFKADWASVSSDLKVNFDPNNQMGITENIIVPAGATRYFDVIVTFIGVTPGSQTTVQLVDIGGLVLSAPLVGGYTR